MTVPQAFVDRLDREPAVIDIMIGRGNQFTVVFDAYHDDSIQLDALLVKWRNARLIRNVSGGMEGEMSVETYEFTSRPLVRFIDVFRKRDDGTTWWAAFFVDDDRPPEWHLLDEGAVKYFRDLIAQSYTDDRISLGVGLSTEGASLTFQFNDRYASS